MQTEEVLHHEELLALVIRSGDLSEGVKFYTEDDNPLQVGHHKYSSGKKIRAHKHCPVKIERYESMQEVLFIKKGSLRVTFYSEDAKKVKESMLGEGDMLLLRKGGHSFEVLDDLEMFEIKQGPFLPESKKILEIEE